MENIINELVEQLDSASKCLYECLLNEKLPAKLRELINYADGKVNTTKIALKVLKMSMNFSGSNTAHAPAEAPKAEEQKQKAVEPKKSEPKRNEKHNQRYINVRWSSYFDTPYIKLYERKVQKNGEEYVFLSTDSKTEEKMDVSFTPAAAQAWDQRTGDYILPADVVIQARNGYAKLFIRAALCCGTLEEVEAEAKKKPQGK